MTTNAFFFSIQSLIHKIPTKNVTTFDTETLELNEFSITYLGGKQLSIQGRILPTKLFKTLENNQEATPSYLWIFETNTHAIILKWQG